MPGDVWQGGVRGANLLLCGVRGVLCGMNCCHLERDPGDIVHNMMKMSLLGDPQGECDGVNWGRAGNWWCHCGQLVS